MAPERLFFSSFTRQIGVAPSCGYRLQHARSVHTHTRTRTPPQNQCFASMRWRGWRTRCVRRQIHAAQQTRWCYCIKNSQLKHTKGSRLKALRLRLCPLTSGGLLWSPYVTDKQAGSLHCWANEKWAWHRRTGSWRPRLSALLNKCHYIKAQKTHIINAVRGAVGSCFAMIRMHNLMHNYMWGGIKNAWETIRALRCKKEAKDPE